MIYFTFEFWKLGSQVKNIWRVWSTFFWMKKMLNGVVYQLCSHFSREWNFAELRYFVRHRKTLIVGWNRAVSFVYKFPTPLRQYMDSDTFKDLPWIRTIWKIVYWKYLKILYKMFIFQDGLMVLAVWKDSASDWIIYFWLLYPSHDLVNLFTYKESRKH